MVSDTSGEGGGGQKGLIYWTSFVDCELPIENIFDRRVTDRWLQIFENSGSQSNTALIDLTVRFIMTEVPSQSLVKLSHSVWH